ncbi:MAG: TIGR03000 domain-containing protein [Pirellulales bacterium]
MVRVPADAKVYVNDHLTKSTGPRRQYTSSGLSPTSVYEYRVRVEFVRAGKPVREEQTVQVTVGKTASLDFVAAPNGQLANVPTTASR